MLRMGKHRNIPVKHWQNLDFNKHSHGEIWELLPSNPWEPGDLTIKDWEEIGTKHHQRLECRQLKRKLSIVDPTSLKIGIKIVGKKGLATAMITSSNKASMSIGYGITGSDSHGMLRNEWFATVLCLNLYLTSVQRDWTTFDIIWHLTYLENIHNYKHPCLTMFNIHVSMVNPRPPGSQGSRRLRTV